ncbi:MAG: hypothetical protein AAFQ42_10970 [Pseudomonadota bacterium]
MPTLFRFLAVIGILVGMVCGGLYVLAVYFEPQQVETREPIGGGVRITK